MKKARLTEIKLKLKTSCVKYLFQTEYLWMFDLYLDERSSLKVRTWTKKGNLDHQIINFHISRLNVQDYICMITNWVSGSGCLVK